MKLFNILASAVLVFSLAACVSNSANGSYVDNSNVNAVIAKDIASKTADLLPAAQSTIYLEDKTTATNPTVVETALREYGFALTQHKNTEGAIKLNYVIDQVYADIFRGQLILNGKNYSRAYQLKDDLSVSSVGAWSVNDSNTTGK